MEIPAVRSVCSFCSTCSSCSVQYLHPPGILMNLQPGPSLQGMFLGPVSIALHVVVMEVEAGGGGGQCHSQTGLGAP